MDQQSELNQSEKHNIVDEFEKLISDYHHHLSEIKQMKEKINKYENELDKNFYKIKKLVETNDDLILYETKSPLIQDTWNDLRDSIFDPALKNSQSESSKSDENDEKSECKVPLFKKITKSVKSVKDSFSNEFDELMKCIESEIPEDKDTNIDLSDLSKCFEKMFFKGFSQSFDTNFQKFSKKTTDDHSNDLDLD